MAMRFPDREALIGGHERLSFAQLATAVDAMAASLLRHGIGKGDKVAILMGNLAELLHFFLKRRQVVDVDRINFAGATARCLRVIVEEMLSTRLS
jgi:non-ribosomal peptide synthetase component E (peptide arylation enzyme)